MKNADMPAMPLPGDGPCEFWDDPTNTSKGTVSAVGLTKREMFAMAAMQGITSACRVDNPWPSCAPDPIEAIANSAVKHADALLEALEES